MRALALLALALLLAGAATLAYAASLGQASFALVLVFPVFVGTGPWGFLGGLLLVAGVIAGLAAVSRSMFEGTLPQMELTYWMPDGPRTEQWPSEPPEPPPRPKVQGGGFLLLGPFPIALGSTKGIAVAMLLLALATLAFLLLLPLLLRGPG